MAKRRAKTRGVTAPAGRRRFWNYPRRNLGKIRRWLPSWRFIVGSFIMMVGLVAGVGAAAYYFTKVPDALPDVGHENSIAYWADGSEMMTWYAQDRTLIEYGDLPQCDGKPQDLTDAAGATEACIANAVVSSEDRTFWTNKGVDPMGIGRALVNNLRGGHREGASTITQQYVERYYKGTTLSYRGKAEEAILAMKIAEKQDKDTIIGNYLNTIYFGRGAYGVEAAASAYFNQSAKDLNYNQDAFISALIPSPRRYETAGGVEAVQKGWQARVDSMYKEGYITKEQHDTAVFPAACTDPAACAPGQVVPKKVEDRKAGPTGYLIQMVEEEMARLGFDEDSLKSHGLRIKTTFDKSMQDAAVATMQSIWELSPAPSDRLHDTLVSIDPKTGAVLSLYGGGPDFLKNPYNYAVQGSAQAGSTFKPFALIAALEQGHSLNERFNGANGISLPGWDKITNFSNANYGNITLTEATARSVNTVYAQLNEKIGPASTAWAAYRAGIDQQGNPNLTKDELVKPAKGTRPVIDVNLANVLGTESVHPVDLANAYATIAAQGTYTPWHVVQEVSNTKDELKVRAQDKYVGQTGAIDPNAALGAMTAMQQVIQDPEGSGHPAMALKRPAAGKTGTSSNNLSAWFAGFTPQLVTVVGLSQTSVDDPNTPKDESTGNDNITPFGKWAKQRQAAITGGTWPVQAWTDYMKVVLADKPVEEFPEYVGAEPSPSAEASDVPTDTAPPAEEQPVGTPPPATVQVPSVAGQSRDGAMSLLRQFGFDARETAENSDSVPAGQVIRTLPDGGASLNQGDAVSVVVSSGPKPKASPAPAPAQPSPPPAQPSPPATPSPAAPPAQAP